VVILIYGGFQRYIDGQVDRLQQTFLETIVELGLEEARADTFMWKAINDSDYMFRTGSISFKERDFMDLSSHYLSPGSMDYYSRNIADFFNTAGEHLDNPIGDDLVEEASHRARAAYLATVGYGDLEYLLGPKRQEFIDNTTFDKSKNLSGLTAGEAQDAFVDEYYRHQERYQVRLSSGVASKVQDVVEEKIPILSTKAGSRSAKTFMGIVDAKQVARAITRL